MKNSGALTNSPQGWREVSDGLGSKAFEAQYVAARSVLLDALDALSTFGKSFIIAGAQAVYLRTQLNDIAIAPYMTDGDLALDPTLLGDEPELESVMRDAGFELSPSENGAPRPGTWVKTASISGQDLVIPVDLIVPEAALENTSGRRGARLGPHGNRAAHRAIGLEAVLVDHDPMEVESLDPKDPRKIEVEVAGVAALLVAKAHKIMDRIADRRADRLSDKDAADVFRIMQTASPHGVGTKLAGLRTHRLAGESTDRALDYMNGLFGKKDGEGVIMAQRALRMAIPERRIATISTSFVGELNRYARK